ncbi:hypothetical protein M2232_009314 [Bradyrhizobium japonicum]|uniref:hypothetical protein n=1 Tax=Bradyrhizobium japonicum TaxID=375 RepID=UPI002225EB46|nr:hypothetical protein [Bradyrhizobium japonicum]MCW2225782.1 hypothetical protein [Bradyrhizobium japonicum]MCW2340993.1 hypothetical protein [Bradyrhizobium japonicum]
MKNRAEPLSQELTIVQRHKDAIGAALDGMDVPEIVQLISEIEDEIRKRRARTEAT